jgi:hypothetical protein
VGLCVPKALNAANWYVSEKYYEAAPPEFRREARQLRKAIGKFQDLLPDTDEHPPFAQMRALHCYGDPGANGNEDGTPEEIEEWHRREDDWDERLSPMLMKKALIAWQGLLADVIGATGTGRTEIAAERGFVSRLAHYWTNELQAPLTAGRGETGKAVRNSGFFPEFVRTAAEIIPQGFRPHTFETAIEQILARET